MATVLYSNLPSKKPAFRAAPSGGTSFKDIGYAAAAMAVYFAAMYLIAIMEKVKIRVTTTGDWPGWMYDLNQSSFLVCLPAGTIGVIAFLIAAILLFKCILDLSERLRANVITLVLSPIALMILGVSCFWPSTWFPPGLPYRNVAMEKEIRDGLDAYGVKTLSPREELMLREAAREAAPAK